MTSLDMRAARRRFGRAALTCSEASVLAREVETRMSERLEYVKLLPRRILDAGCGLGEGSRLLHRRYPGAAIIGVDLALAMAREARSRRPLLARARSRIFGAASHHVCADMSRLPLARSSVGLVWSNLAIAWAASPAAVFSEFHRVIKIGGLLMFSTYGPDTLSELRQAFARVDEATHVHQFADMHDLGDMLAGAGFAEPVMDMERITVTFSDVAALARDLRMSGQSNVATDRPRGLMARRTWKAMERHYEAARRDGRLPATFEIVFGHAWKPAPRLTNDGRMVVNTQSIGRRTR